MATRNGTHIDLVWLLIDRSDSRAADFRTTANNLNKEKVTQAVLSENISADGTQGLIKMVHSEDDVKVRIPGPLRRSVIRIFTEKDFGEALAMVQSSEWTGIIE